MSYSIIGPNLFMNERGKLFEKVAEEYQPLMNKYIEAEERFVQRNLKRGGHEYEHEND